VSNAIVRVERESDLVLHPYFAFRVWLRMRLWLWLWLRMRMRRAGLWRHQPRTPYEAFGTPRGSLASGPRFGLIEP
jgi:hypothetical protein